MSTDAAPERAQTLVTVTAPLLAWAAHFVAAYSIAAIVCAKGLPLGVLRIAIGVVTAATLLVVARFGLRGLSHARAVSEPHDAPTGPARRGFLGLLVSLIAALAAVAVAYSALVFVLVRDCR